MGKRKEYVYEIYYKRSDSSVTIELDGFDLLDCGNMTGNGYENLQIQGIIDVSSLTNCGLWRQLRPSSLLVI